MRLAWLAVVGACGSDPQVAQVVPGGEALATTDAVRAIAADDETVAWITQVGVDDPLETVWQIEPGATPAHELYSGLLHERGAPGRIALANHQPYWEQRSDQVRILTVDGDAAIDTTLGGSSMLLLGGDGPYLARLDASIDVQVADPRTGPDRAAWQGLYLLAGRHVVVGAGKLVLATTGRAQTIALGTGVTASFDLGAYAPQALVPARDGFWFVDAEGAVVRVTAAGASHVADLPAPERGSRFAVNGLAAVGDDLWVAAIGDGHPPDFSVLVRIGGDGTVEQRPVLALSVRVASGGNTLYAVTYDDQQSTVWRVAR